MKKVILIALVVFGLGAIFAESARADRGTLTTPYRPPVKTPTAG